MAALQRSGIKRASKLELLIEKTCLVTFLLLILIVYHVAVYNFVRKCETVSLVVFIVGIVALGKVIAAKLIKKGFDVYGVRNNQRRLVEALYRVAV